ncbi:MAG: hypothetical protein EXS35_04875 [Pedosphaera sp.]|nr:hypothetical protein [Pedosphaera sp.]
MKRWALVVVVMYGLILAVLALSVTWLAFAGAGKSSVELKDAANIFAEWLFWAWIGVMLLGQIALLKVPVSLANRRPVTRRSLWLPVIAAGLMMGGLAIGAAFAVAEFFGGEHVPDWAGWGALALGAVVWIVWAVVFYGFSRDREPRDVVSRQCNLMLKGSILELLIAVPTHIVARSRDYCCAGFMTFMGIALGISVMLFSFGPAVFFLYVERWRRLHPAAK